MLNFLKSYSIASDWDWQDLNFRSMFCISSFAHVLEVVAQQPIV